jgi:hypothetical protein
MYEVGVPLHPNRLHDITDLADRKHQAMRCFVSQLQQQAYDRHVRALNVFRTYTLAKDVLEAEAYRMLDQAALRSDPLRAIRPALYYAQQAHCWTRSSGPLVSVVVRCLGYGPPAELLDGIALQTHADIEVILVAANVGCTFDLAPWAGRFPMRALAVESPTGLARAANMGIDAAAGQYIAVLDEGVGLLPNHCAALLQALADRPGSRCAYSAMANGAPVKSKDDSSAGGLPVDRIDIWARDAIPVSAMMFDRSLCVEGCRFDEHLAAPADWDFCIQLSLRTNFAHSAEASIYRIASGADIEVAEPGREQASVPPEGILEKWKSVWSGQELASLIHRVDVSNTSTEARQAGFAAQVAEEEKAPTVSGDDVVDPLPAATSALKQQLAEAKQANAALQKQIAELRNATSWKITRPLRAISRAARAVVRRAGL